jgi:preprotein translocase subunit SecA
MIMERVGMEEGEPIEHRYTTRAIENAQKKVEAHNFDIRKHLLEYDDVMNKQREVVYSQRKFILSGENLRETVLDMLDDVVEGLVDTFTDERSHFDDWDLAGLVEACWGQFGIRFDFKALPASEQNGDGITDHIIDEVKKAYERKEQEFTLAVMRELEKFIMLQSVDNQWKDHLLGMDHLKDGIGLRGYGQRDPLKEYQKEGYEMFLDMSQRIREETVRALLLVKLAEEEVSDLAPKHEQEMVLSHGSTEGGRSKTVRRNAEKVGRNAPCPCGSGKKYKKCCGKAA